MKLSAMKLPPSKLHSANGAFHTSMGRSPMNTSPSTTRAESPAYMPLEPNVVTLARSNNKIRPVHLDTNAAVLVPPRVTWNVEGNLIPEKPALSKAPIGSSTSRINQMRDLHPFRTHRTGPEKHHRLSHIIVEYLEIPLLKVSDALSRCSGDHNIEANVSRSGTASSRSLLHRSCGKTKHHSRQNGKYTLVDEHKLTPIDVIRPLWTKSLVRNCIPDHMLQSHLAISGPSPKTQSNFQSTIASLTPTINLTHTPNSPAQAGLHHLTHHSNHPKSKPKVSPSKTLHNFPQEGEVP